MRKFFHSHNQSSSTPIDNTNLMLWLKFDEGSGSTANDTMGINGIPSAQLYGPYYWVNPGHKIGAYAINMGGNSYATLNQQTWFNPGTGDFTICTWVKMNSLDAGDHWIYSTYGADLNSLVFLRLLNDKFQINARDSSLNIATATSTSTLSASVWYWVAAVKQGQTVKIYVDNVLEATSTNPSLGAVNTDGTGDERPTIGRYPLFGGTSYFGGELDDFRYYTEALSPARMLEVFNYT